MPSYTHIERYHADLQRLIDFGGSDNEQSIRRAFAVCLDSYCRDHREKLALVDELDAGSRVAGTGIRPDGTVKDSLRMARGYWEAKDTHDDLDAEIQAKFNRGYPRDNILFEDSADRRPLPERRRGHARRHVPAPGAAPAHPPLGHRRWSKSSVTDDADESSPGNSVSRVIFSNFKSSIIRALPPGSIVNL